MQEALRELLDSLKDEGEVWRSMMGIRGKEEKWILGKTKDDHVHNIENPVSWLFFAFDGDRLVGHVNGKVENTKFLKSAPLHVRQHQ